MGKRSKALLILHNYSKKPKKEESYIVIRFHKLPYPLVLKSKDLKAAGERIFQRYGIGKAQFIGPHFQKNKAGLLVISFYFYKAARNFI